MSKTLETSSVSNLPDLPLLCRQFIDRSYLPMAAVEGAKYIVRHVNRAFCSLLEKSSEELIGKPFAELMPAQEKCMPSPERVELMGMHEIPVEPDHGAPPRPQCWSFSLWPVQIVNGRPLGIMIQAMETARFFRQATEMNQALLLTAVRNHEFKEHADSLNLQMGEEILARKQMEERLLGSLQALRDLQAAVDEHSIVTIADPQGRLTYVNDKFCAISQYSREELLGQDHRIVNAGLHPKEFIREIWATIGQGKVWKGELKDQAKDGTLYWMETTIAPCLNSAGRPFQYMAIRTDITARKNTEAALLESQRNAEHANNAKDDFIAALSHELRTPLTPVLLVASSLEGDANLEPGLHDQLELIRRNIALEAQLIDDLLDVTKIARGKILLRPSDVDFHQLLFRALETVGDEISRKKIELKIETEAHHFHASADPTRIQQVFWNLLKNAAKFAPEGGAIHIRTSNSDNQTLCVEIRDNGIGIAAEHLASLFTPFEQGAATGDHRFGGLGLGLAISKAIIELHGGCISAASGGIGQGATFTIRLPVSLSVTAAQMPSNIPPKDVTARLRILLVEDDENTRTVLARLLRREGHEVEAVGTCTEANAVAHAVKKRGARPFQAIISDLGLPDGSGLNLIREIKAQFPEVKAVAVSGYGTDDDIRKTAEAGFNHHLIKPIELQDLRRALAA